MRNLVFMCALALLPMSALAEEAAVVAPELVGTGSVSSELVDPELVGSGQVVPDVANKPAAVNEADETMAAAVPAAATEIITPSRFQARIEKHSAEEIYELLSRAEKIAAGRDEYSTKEPVVLVLSGEEIELFKRENYRNNKSLVDLAARLDAFNIIDVKVCTNWMSQRGIELTDLPPFVDNVPQADQESMRLEKDGYAYF